ncbi:NAD-dependent epimerase/dehydratase family protein [Umezawaea sp. Da 62-37]|uniref:NAD-dependent epimerase/dehydratase family protein n=1 Tax=Umezawaea sp. Da 62-37 TaxID=3075927 RepID=UPI0028F71392|nr:NAD-dependent epimerase/dehydratase family protein [Umezawaea sp. Da 62-37]WNV91206.1 NAD-dependent epimerase/dehydratase family protein [Umezawaea sp. Da 62-37]
MRILVLGGTVFLSKAVAAESVRRGHEVLCAARGTTGAVPDGAELVVVDRDRPGALEVLRGEHFDAVVDVAKMSVNWVREALHVLGDSAPHWTFVSSCSVYQDHSKAGQSVESPTLPPLEDDPSAPFDANRYGSVKVASEHAVLDAVGDRAFVLRAGLITGPGDPSDRFGYWPARMSQGGQVAVPDAPDQAASHVDVRDLAAWIVDSAENRLVGTFDGTGPSEPLSFFLGEIAGAVAPQGTELVRVPLDVLERLRIAPWAGPRSMPLWLTDSHLAMMFRDARPAMAAGLRVRSVGDTARDSLAYEYELGIDRVRRAGLTASEEYELLSAL